MLRYENRRDEYLSHMAKCSTCNATTRPYLNYGRHDYVATANLCSTAKALLDKISILFGRNDEKPKEKESQERSGASTQTEVRGTQQHQAQQIGG